MIIAVIALDASYGILSEIALAQSQAEAVGRELAQRGHLLICGGRGGVRA